ncbi:glycine dehydrogenase subunit 1 [Devosia subaequoris]|uniref:Probable glycine dehydrogenase (decarboxylating) subunit 1 n=1 Tax=Devosia subaequoris TaxID=395930 RepID=A0A7W6IPB5_9HYPH|nr:aminomethyl-transferring glycine dehydrogenase subunit GcvPA [Devosia subaequoris]MBB4053266.1 glycine dehydrogenase subunit 1 [Devosia subaequoris]MCP1210604.1 aminomethyl-transferring glycine dehydrogenase subunit GcvPA [Devosia subaequoris]
MRYLPHSAHERAEMLGIIGAADIEALFSAVPKTALKSFKLDLPDHSPEFVVEAHMRALANKNQAGGDGPFFVGAGAYRHHVPATVDHLIQRSEWLTAYTPYQPEISQGTLQMLFEFQTQVAKITGMDVANASLYDGSTGTAEAVLMARRLTRRSKIVLSGGLHPHYRDVVKSYLKDDADLVCLSPSPEGQGDILEHIDDTTAAIVVQTPDFYGHLRDLKSATEAAHAQGALLIVVVTEVVSLGLLEAPGALGADIVVAEGQSIGNALNFGGPYLGLMATRKEFIRQMPGRICGETVDADGNRGFVLTLSTREQHIRREKATSNICTNSGLCALAFSIHMGLLGEAGFVRLARLNHATAIRLADALEGVPGVTVLNETFFNEMTIRVPQPAAGLVERLAQRGILAGVPASRLLPEDPEVDNLLILAATELTTDADIAALCAALTEELA